MTGINPMGKGFELAENLLRYTQTRQKVLSSNIANVDTPGYRAKDLGDFKAALQSERLAMQTTDPGHIAPQSSIPRNMELMARDTEPWEDKNNIEMDVEVSKMTENTLMYEAGVRIISGKISSFKRAVSGR